MTEFLTFVAGSLIAGSLVWWNFTKQLAERDEILRQYKHELRSQKEQLVHLDQLCKGLTNLRQDRNKNDRHENNTCRN